MPESDQGKRQFAVVGFARTSKGLVLIHESVEEAKLAYAEAIRNGVKASLAEDRITLLAFGEGAQQG